MFIDLTQDSILRHPQWQVAFGIAQVLRSNGHDVLFAGGCVRDFILGRQAVDIDVATSARPEQVQDLFAKTVAVGKSFGVIRVVDQGHEIEVASFRKDGLYVDGRRPETVEYSTPLEDAQRRDFTINALFLNPFTGEVLDYVDGLKDLHNQMIKAVGVARDRFAEDHLRILRAVRFVAQLGFSLDPQTQRASHQLAGQVTKVSAERRHQELTKLLQGEFLRQALSVCQAIQIWPVIAEASRQWDFTKLRAEFILPLQKFGSVGVWFGFFTSLHISEDEALQFMKEFKWSTQEQRWICGALNLTHNCVTRLQGDLGSWLVAYHQVGSLLNELQGQTGFLKLSAEQGQIWQERIKVLRGFGSKLPEPLIRGEDLQLLVQGPRLGEVLRWAYARQLEGVIMQKSQGIELCRQKLNEEKES